MANAMARGSWTPSGWVASAETTEGQHVAHPTDTGHLAVRSSEPSVAQAVARDQYGQVVNSVGGAAPVAQPVVYAPHFYAPQDAQASRGHFFAQQPQAQQANQVSAPLPFAYAHLGQQGGAHQPASSPASGAGFVPFTPPTLSGVQRQAGGPQSAAGDLPEFYRGQVGAMPSPSYSQSPPSQPLPPSATPMGYAGSATQPMMPSAMVRGEASVVATSTSTHSPAAMSAGQSSAQTAPSTMVSTATSPSVRVQPVPAQTLPPPAPPERSSTMSAASGVRAPSQPLSARPAANAPFPVAAPHATGKFAALGHPRRIWVVSSIHGEVDKLRVLHDEIGRLFQPGDRLVYLGNFLGVGPDVLATVDELLDFRRALIAMPGMLASDVVYLRGGQEEMWSKLLQIQFAPNPVEVMNWMLRQGAEVTLNAYRGNPAQGLAAARDGVMAMTRWTSLLRAEIRTHPGHETLYSSLKRAAFTGDGAQTTHGGLLFVNAGLDYNKPLASQGDSFWWGAASWGSIVRPYGVFSKVIRGYDPAHGGSSMTTHTLTIDGGCGFGGSLMGACLTASGEVIDVIEV